MRIKINAADGYVDIDGERHAITNSGKNGGTVWCEFGEVAQPEPEPEPEPEPMTTENVVQEDEPQQEA